MRKTAAGPALAILILGAACLLRPPLSDLDPVSRDFLSKARYLISKEEKAAFLDLQTADDRNAYIERFWARRDPDPDTEINEFKVEYFARIDEATRLFREGGTPGWMTERGRLYITLGPPENRVSYPRGVTFYGKPTEVWYYNFFPVQFVDDNWSGTYHLDPVSAGQIGEITKTQTLLKPRPATMSERLQNIPLEVEASGPGEAVVRIALPYKEIWLGAEGDAFKASLGVALEAADSKGAVVWSESRSFPISLAKDEYLKKQGESFLIEVPVKLAPGEYRLKVVLTDLFPGARAEKKVKLLIS
jgi:GWxTD domain-containing protein